MTMLEADLKHYLYSEMFAVIYDLEFTDLKKRCDLTRNVCGQHKLFLFN